MRRNSVPGSTRRPSPARAASERRPAVDGRTFETLDPATGDVLARVAWAGAADVDAAVEAARRAFAPGTDWRRMSAAERLIAMSGRLRDRLLISASGDHTIQVALTFQGNGYGVFSYLRGYKFEVNSLGKLATWFLYTSLALVMVVHGSWPRWIFWTGFVLAVASLVQYFLKARNQGKRERRISLC